VIAVAVALSWGWSCTSAEENNVIAPLPALVVQIESTSASVVYTVEGNRATNVVGLLDLLRTQFRGRGDPRTVVGVFARNVPIEQLSTLRGTAMKIGYERVRFFRQDRDSEWIHELVLGRSYYVRDDQLIEAVQK